MKINTTDKGEILLTEVYSGVLLETDDKETIGICMRDTGFEFNYNGVWYEAKQGIVREMNKEEPKQDLEKEMFEEAVKPLMKWLSENTHPHTTVIVKSNCAELVEGIKVIETNEFLID